MNQKGAIWGSTPINMNNPFFYQFGINLGSITTGADGMAFMLQNATTSPNGGGGSSALGYVGGGLGAAGIGNSFGVEFDTYQNVGPEPSGLVYNDPSYDHTAIFSAGDNTIVDPNNTSQLNANGITNFVSIGTNGNVKDGQYHTVTFTWDPSSKNFTYTFDGAQIASITRDIVNLDLGGSSAAYFGFTASTGGQVNRQSVCNQGQGNGTIVADVGVTVTDNKTTYSPGGTNIYTVVVSNGGPSPVVGLTVADSPSSPFASESWTATGTSGTVYPAAGSGSINTAAVNIPKNGSVTFTVTANFANNQTGPFTYTVNTTVPSGTSDPIPGNNSASDTDALLIPSATPTFTSTSTSTNTPTFTPTFTSTFTPTNTATFTPTNTSTSTPTSTFTFTPSKTATSTSTNTITSTATFTPSNTATSTATPVLSHIDTIGIYRNSNFHLRLHNNVGFSDINATLSIPGVDLPVVGDWTGVGYDAIGVYDQSAGRFSLRNSNTNGSADEQFLFGNPNDTPLSGRWFATAAHAGVGVYRPSNGILYVANSLVTGFSDHAMILGNPGDQGIAGDWTGRGYDGPGVFRPTGNAFYLLNQVSDGVVFSDINFLFGSVSDVAITGDWISQGHDGVGVFRPANATMNLKNGLVSGSADNTFNYGSPTDQPIAGHWQVTYPPIAPAPVLIPKTAAPQPTTPGNSAPGGNQIGG